VPASASSWSAVLAAATAFRVGALTLDDLRAQLARARA
jgi:hypothetical protein